MRSAIFVISVRIPYLLRYLRTVRTDVNSSLSWFEEIQFLSATLYIYLISIACIMYLLTYISDSAPNIF